MPPTAYANGSALVFYNSTTYRDDMTWAAAWMYKATGEPVNILSAFHGDTSRSLLMLQAVPLLDGMYGCGRISEKLQALAWLAWI
jgi:hypothetical protein